MRISASLITLNEEHNIDRALKSLDFVDEIVVVDSFSKDKTVEIAKKYGAKVIEHEFLGYGQQKNLAAEHCQGEWILNLDADEEVTPELRQQILKIIDDPQSMDLYQINRKTNFCGQWIEHGGWFPGHISRLCRKGKAQWTTPHVHEDLKLLSGLGPVGKIDEILNHYSFPTVESQIVTNLKFAKLGAKDLLKRKGKRPSTLALLLRPLGKFFECYFLKLGMLDGKEGFIIAVNAMHSMFMKYSMASLEDASEQKKS